MKDYNLDLIQVLWVEDDPGVIESYPLEAYNFGVQLVAFPCWDEAKAALENDFDRWSAIILDAKCKYHRDSEDNAVRFLGRALNDIALICEKRGRVIPWYVLTGGDAEEVSDSINDDRMKWDADWTNSTHKEYYSKNVDNEILYQRIKAHARKSPRLQVQQMYEDVFDAIEELDLNVDAEVYLEDLLLEIHFPKLDNKDYNDKYKKVRQIVEYIFRSMMQKGLLPPQCKINLTSSNRILSGQNIMEGKGNDAVVIVEVEKAVLPKIIQDNIIHMIHTAGSDVHTEEGADTNSKHITEYLKDVGNTSYLLKSYALQLCDVILWYKNYIDKHNDEEINALNWTIKDTAKFKKHFNL